MTRKIWISLAFLLLTGAAWSLSGCADREHIRDDFGERTREWYARQRVYTEAATEAPKGLDSEEAAAIHGTYRKNMGESKRRQRDDTSRVLVIDDSERRRE